jgi:cathepsin B
MKSAIFFAFFLGLVMGETCKANGDSCVAHEDEVTLMQLHAQVRKSSEKTHKYGPYETQRSALEYFKHWSQGKVQSHMSRLRLWFHNSQQIISRAPGHGQMKTAARVVHFLQMHRQRQCPRTAHVFRKKVYTLHDLSHHSNGVEHFLLLSVNGSLQYVAKHANHIIAAYPELCHEGPDPALLQTRRKRHQKGDPKKDPPKKGGSPKNLDPKTDHLVKDCEDLFARTAKEKCGEEFELKTLNAVEKVIDGLAIEMQVEVGKKGEDKTKLHDITCEFEVSSPSTGGDAKLLQKDLPKKDAPADGTGPTLKDMLPEEKKGLVATLSMEINLCKADTKSTMSAIDIEFFALRKTKPSGELSRYKGYEHVNDNLPKVTSQVLAQFGKGVPDSYDLRTEFPTCYLDSYKEPVRDQGQCGSCWAFASATAAMNNLCGSNAAKDSQSMAADTDRYEVSVQQIMSCNKDDVGCDGGYMSATDQALRDNGITRERTSPYKCGGGDPLNHFDAKSDTCDAAPWGGTCDAKLADAGWNWGGAFVLQGEDSMTAMVAQGYSLYASLDVYGNFMTLADEIYSATTGSKKGGHALVIVAYGVDSSSSLVQQSKGSANVGGTKYWVLQNSWGTSWGVNGYGKMLKGDDLAGIETDAYYARAWVSQAKDTPPCFDGDSSGLIGGSGPIPCKDIQGGAYGDLCDDPGWKPTVSKACPVTCNACIGGKSGPVSPSPAATDPAPAPAPPPTPANPAPAPAPTTCKDDDTYTDPYFGDDCKGWSKYLCTGFDFTTELESYCPVACKTCKPGAPANCQDDPSYTDPMFGDGCVAWAKYLCSGFSFSDDLEKACPTACKMCT